MAVVGASGSGKSSLVRAGLIPAFRRVRQGSVAVMTPGSDPEAELGRSVGRRPPSLLVVDQFEEAFTLCPDEAGRGRFFDALIDLYEAGATSIVVALRADFYGRCAEHPRLAAALSAHQCLLGPMQTDELRRAIEGPAGGAGLRLETGLSDAMLADVEGEPGALPLLSHALYESWARRDGRVLTRAGYVAAGGVRGAIAHTAEEVFLGCSRQEQVLMRRMFFQLTELGETTEDTRRRVPLTELIPEGEGGEEATAVLERLAGSRLLVVGDDSAEIAHEALIREWPRLRGWLAENREELRARRRLTTAARAWEEAGRDEADLYRGPRLAAAIEPAGEERQLSRVEREFLEASRDAQDRELAERSAPGQASARPARGRRGRAGGGVDRRGRRPGPTWERAALGRRGAVRTARRSVAGGGSAASGPRAPARAGGGPSRRLGRHARCAPGRARARIADPYVAQGVRLARKRHRVQPGREAPGHHDRRGDDPLGHADLEARRAAAAILAGRLGGSRLQPGRSNAGDRGRRRATSSCGTSNADVSFASSSARALAPARHGPVQP